MVPKHWQTDQGTADRHRMLSPTFDWASAKCMVRPCWVLQISQLQLHLLHWQSSNGFRILPSVWNGTKLPSSDSCKLMLKKQGFLKFIYQLPSKHIFLYICKIGTTGKHLNLFAVYSLDFSLFFFFLTLPQRLYFTQNSTADSLTAS